MDILIMEDHPDLLRLYTKSLRSVGYHVAQAATLAEARALLNQRRFDLFVCDMQMGTESGLDLLGDYRDAFRQQATQVLVVSAQDEYRAACVELGFDVFLAKPISLKTLTQMAEKIIPRSA